MKRVEFDIELAKKVANHEIEGKFVTRNGQNIRIICFDMVGKAPIVALVTIDGLEYIRQYSEYGVCFGINDKDRDLLIKI